MTEERERELRIRLEVLEHAIKQYNSVYILAPFIQEKKTIERILDCDSALIHYIATP